MPSVPTTIPEFEHRGRPWQTSGGVWIGGACDGSLRSFSRDAERIQTALLKFPTTREGYNVTVIETDTSLRARAARALRSFTSALRRF